MDESIRGNPDTYNIDQVGVVTKVRYSERPSLATLRTTFDGTSFHVSLPHDPHDIILA